MSELLKNIVRLPPPHTARSYSELTPVYTADEVARTVASFESELAKANERVRELEERCSSHEKDMFRQCVFMEKTAEKLEQHREWQATANVLRRPTREAKKAVNKFAIEKQLETARKCVFGSTGWVLEHIEFLEEQLRKEQE